MVNDVVKLSHQQIQNLISLRPSPKILPPHNLSPAHKTNFVTLQHILKYDKTYHSPAKIRKVARRFRKSP